MLNKFLAILAGIVTIGINRTDVHQPLSDTRLYLDKYSAVSQTFTSTHNNMNIVSICIRNPNREMTPFEFAVYEGTSSAAAVRTLAFTGGNIDNQDCTRFQFEPIADSAGKSYVAEVRATRPREEYPRVGIYVESYAGEDSVDGAAYQDTKMIAADLHMKTAYRERLTVTVTKSITEFFTRAGQDLLFFILYGALFIYILIRIFRLKK